MLPKVMVVVPAQFLQQKEKQQHCIVVKHQLYISKQGGEGIVIRRVVTGILDKDLMKHSGLTVGKGILELTL